MRMPSTKAAATSMARVFMGVSSRLEVEIGPHASPKKDGGIIRKAHSRFGGARPAARSRNLPVQSGLPAGSPVHLAGRGEAGRGAGCPGGVRAVTGDGHHET